VFWEIAVANSRDRTIGGILPVWFGLGMLLGAVVLLSSAPATCGRSGPPDVSNLDEGFGQNSG